MKKFACFLAMSVATGGVAFAGGDAAAGKAKHDDTCGSCHEKADWAGQDAAAVESKIKDVVSGKTKHKKKITLTDADIANIAAYWSSK